MKAIAATLAVSSILFLGACAQTPAPEASKPTAEAPSKPLTTRTPEPISEAVVEAPVASAPPAEPAAVAASPADPAILQKISSINNCMIGQVMRKTWQDLSVNTEIPAPKKAEAADYAVRTDQRMAELGCTR
jgi:PBP1b-binding outer membrane lipoprotein LpoB